ncbi:MAG: hypothetical protein V2J24_23670 [Pseudomonadales bacterium]|jgi:hypothetical protein|nr:hypothetical protein [Pseudomonadales bacterium]
MSRIDQLMANPQYMRSLMALRRANAGESAIQGLVEGQGLAEQRQMLRRQNRLDREQQQRLDALRRRFASQARPGGEMGARGYGPPTPPRSERERAIGLLGTVDPAAALKEQLNPTAGGLRDSNIPSDVRSARWFAGLSPEEQRQVLTYRRAPYWQDTGGGTAAPRTGLPTDRPQPTPAEYGTREGVAADAAKDVEAAGDARREVGGARLKAGQTLQAIRSLRNHPGRAAATGRSAVVPLIAGTAAYDFNELLEQLKGKVFLEAFESLKGAGTITEIEGLRAERALGRLNRAQSEEAFMEALRELEEVVQANLSRIEDRAGGDFGLTDEDRRLLGM